MKPIYYLIISSILGLFFWAYLFWASYGTLPAKVKQLQDDVQMLKSPVDSVKGKGLDLQKLEFKIEKTEQSIREDFDWIKKFGLPLTFLALGALFYSIYKSALGLALEKARETVNRYYLPEEDRFKREKKLLVLTKEGDDSGFIRQLFYDTGFLEVTKIPDNIKKLDEATLIEILEDEKYDLIFLNNGKSHFDENEITTCLSKTPHYTMIFNYNKNLPPNIVTSQRVTSVNFKSQIYGNLINALKYQKYLREPSTINKV